MTDTTKQAECNPEKICVRFCEFDGIKMASKTHPKSSEYIRADLVEARELELIKATLEFVGDYAYRTGQCDLNISSIDPLTIIEGMKDK